MKVLWDLCVDRLSVMLIDRNRKVARQKDLIEKLLDFKPETHHFKDGKLKLMPIFSFLNESLPDDALEELVR